MASIFTRIIRGELPSYKIYEDDRFLAILDINPNTRGHTLCIPKQEQDKLFSLSETDYLDLMKFAYYVAQGIEKAIDCNRVAMAVIGLEVPHVHVHLIPVNNMRDVTFKSKIQLSKRDLEETAKAISQHLN